MNVIRVIRRWLKFKKIERLRVKFNCPHAGVRMTPMIHLKEYKDTIMGLDTTHGCWSGSYTAFNQFRDEVAKAAGMEGFSDAGGTAWESLEYDVIHAFLNRSDCDGWIEWSVCHLLADRLEELLPLESNWCTTAAKKFIDGLRKAYNLRENVEFL